ncbi:tRNA pseudouridine(55) synthase TruB [Spiroplasma turonicum]|uniref:tRNA pseudouridine synthase B n=1 Tax=Spiroplasma turonicum TaxID=216946 RepID=A0A0K1P5Y0_9MOLU|nr:tRNA pseudouridine(55) synthase TruB [Spiroplasma turonicum]AKU79584.1 tRNA pseudouridine synthase B [Spiroplasma turonicum]ALX70606.1 tRNA pseudouridine synthase B [Spiroplasma turonicum]
MNKSGVFLIDKPKGITSNQLIQQIKNKFKIKKIGHAGTLDPMARGLMVVLVNHATKVSNYLLSSDKRYIVTMDFFMKTDTMDVTGKTIETQPFEKIDKKLIKEMIDKFDGYMYEQYPPIYSATKQNGKKLYEYARSGESVEIKSKTVTIKKCNYIDFDQKSGRLSLDVLCSKGTYIRSLISDMAESIGYIATMSVLNRVECGKFSINDAKTLEELNESDLISIYDSLMINEQNLIEYHKTSDIYEGRIIELQGVNFPFIFVINHEKEVLAVYKHVAQNIYKCQRGLWESKEPSFLTDAEKEGYYDNN